MTTATTRPSLAAALGLSKRVFASPADRRLLDAVEAGLERVEEALPADVAFVDDIADAASRYLLAAGGKRVRPALALITAQIGGGISDDVIAAARAVELTHLASLYHDDVMDDAELRRGVPTAQHVWGNSVAILTGDLLFARASRIFAGLGERALRIQTETFEQLCLGQLHETVGPRGGEDPIEHYLGVLRDKTGSLIALAAMCGIVFSGGSEAYEEPLREYGERVGIAFQLSDDVIDLSPDSDTTGKSAGTDIRAGVPTLPTLLLRARAAEDAEAAALVELLDSDVEAAIPLIRDHQVTRDTLAEARRWAKLAAASLAVLPAGSARTALERFADAVVERTT